MRIAYLLYNERPMSGLVTGQVLEPLLQLKRRHPGWQITVIAVWQPWVALRQGEPLRQMRELLAAAGIRLESWPMALIPSRYFQYKASLLPLLVGFNRVTFRALRLGRFDVVHPRGYLASAVAASRGDRLPFALVFDPRSHFPEEWVTTGHWTLGSRTYRAWKRLEALVMSRARAVIGVSPAMVERLRAMEPRGEVVHIPIAGDAGRLRFDATVRDEWRRRMGLTGHYVLAYQGSLGHERQGNNIETYADYLARIRQVVKQPYFLFVVPEVLPGFAQVLRDRGIPDSEFTFVEGAADLPRWLSVADAGMHLMRIGPDAATRFGVKVVEYLLMGLPVLTNSGAGAAADFVEQHDIGARIDLDDEAFAARLQQATARPAARDRLRAIAESSFGAGAIASHYAALYQRITAGR